ncbi:MAG TPA: MATE family efflux transporter [Devosia sp.]
MSSNRNGFIADPIPAVLIRTALPIVFITSMNGLLTVVDAALLGAFAGREALAAVTVMFPASMLLIALSTMVSSGMASILARQLGARSLGEARATFAGAHGLALVLFLAVIVAFVAFGEGLTSLVADGSDKVAAMAHQFLMITVFTSPLLFLVSVQSDALRVEGRVGFMALAGLLVSVGNIAFNIAMIAGLGLGVAGSAMGTAAAQAVALTVILIYRLRGRGELGTLGFAFGDWSRGWAAILSLGAARSLSFLGIALGSVAIIAAVRLYAPANAETTIAAYGIVTRLMTFAYLPLLGLSLAMQAVAGNNIGAGLWPRSAATLRLSIIVALVYGAMVELVLLAVRGSIGGWFVADAGIVRAVGDILPIYVALYFTLGPMMMIASYFQSMGDARRSAFLSLARTYLFAVPLTFALPALLGETGIWAAMPSADLLLVLTTALVLLRPGPANSPGLFVRA